MKLFDKVIRCTLSELYNCAGVDGFDDLIEEKLGHGIADANWILQGVVDGDALIHVTGEVFNEDEAEELMLNPILEVE